MNDFLKQNIEALYSVNPLAASRVFSVAETKRFEVFVDSDPANINIIDMHTNTPLYYGKPIDEIKRKLISYEEKALYPYLYFYGLGNGIFYKLILNNEYLKRVVVIEPELELLYIGLHFVDLTKEIKDGRFVVVYGEDFDFVTANTLIGYKDAKIYSKLYDLDLLCPFYNRYKNEFIEANRLFIRAIEHQVISVGNDSTDAVMGMEHHIKNIPDVISSPTIFEFLKKVKNTNTAVIVSTGPSLAKQLPRLKEIQDYVTILCIDASFPILCSWGIKPDVVISIERIPLTAEFYKKTPIECQEEVVFAITSIVHEELKNSIKKGTKFFSLRPFGYTKYYGLDEWGYMGIGMSAANKAFEIAYYARFENCILIGQDLAYGEDGSTHSSGYVLNKDEFKPSETNIYVEKYGGGGVVRTNNIWKLFLNYFEADISKAIESMNVINATEGGARIRGATEMSFFEATERFVDKSKKKEKIVLEHPSSELQKEALNRVKEKLKNLFNKGYEYKKEIESAFLELMKMTKKWEELNEQNRLEELDFDEILKFIDRLDAIKEYFLDEEFNEMFIDAVQSYIIHQELEIAKIYVKNPKDPWLKKAKLLEWIYAHKYWLFSLAGGLDVVLNVSRNAALTWMDPNEVPEIPKTEWESGA